MKEVYSFAVYSTSKNSYIVPESQYKEPKDLKHIWLIDGEYEICTKKVKLARYLGQSDDIVKLLNALVMEIPNAK
jgi:hypothetical protein